jgi:hypothetical protein
MEAPDRPHGSVVRVDDFETPLAGNAKPYVLVIASEWVPAPIGIKLARAWIDAQRALKGITEMPELHRFAISTG